jgi:L,D-transpeptidase YcbB
MKSILPFLAAILLMQSCVSDSTEKNTTTTTTTFFRDSTITKENGYSDLFLDSNAISSFIQKQKLDDSSAQTLRNFYTVRNNEFAWFTSQGLTEQGKSFWSLYANGGDSASNKEDTKRLKQQMDTIIQKDSMQINSNDSSYLNTELALTQQLIRFASRNNGAINKNNIYTLVPRKKMDPMQLADSIINKQKDTTAFATSSSYNAMRQQLAVYYNAAKNGGWQTITVASGLKKGSGSPAVVSLKKRLQATGDYPAGDTSNVFSDSLVSAVKDVQLRNGLAATGVVNDSLLNVLNVPAQQRVQQILLNMNRLVWTQSTADANHIEVNIPSQMLYAYEGNNKVFEMPVIVGKEGTSTIAFDGKISQVVFNPTWHLPESIIRNEVMPAMKKDPGYLKKKNMEVVKQNDSVPVINQLPGKDNPLGKVKFLFPNSFDIYLHDTPNKSLFQQKNRALSHGCIRVADPEKLAQYLLRNQSDWTPEKIHQAMNSNKEQTVAVSNPEAVQINALTAWTDATGKINFRNDLSGHDTDAMARLFTTANGSQNMAAVQTDSTHTNKDLAGKKTIRKPKTGK